LELSVFCFRIAIDHCGKLYYISNWIFNSVGIYTLSASSSASHIFVLVHETAIKMLPIFVEDKSLPSLVFPQSALCSLLPILCILPPTMICIVHPFLLMYTPKAFCFPEEAISGYPLDHKYTYLNYGSHKFHEYVRGMFFKEKRIVCLRMHERKDWFKETEKMLRENNLPRI